MANVTARPCHSVHVGAAVRAQGDYSNQLEVRALALGTIQLKFTTVNLNSICVLPEVTQELID